MLNLGTPYSWPQLPCCRTSVSLLPRSAATADPLLPAPCARRPDNSKRSGLHLRGAPDASKLDQLPSYVISQHPAFHVDNACSSLRLLAAGCWRTGAPSGPFPGTSPVPRRKPGAQKVLGKHLPSGSSGWMTCLLCSSEVFASYFLPCLKGSTWELVPSPRNNSLPLSPGFLFS